MPTETNKAAFLKAEAEYIAYEGADAMEGLFLAGVEHGCDQERADARPGILKLTVALLDVAPDTPDDANVCIAAAEELRGLKRKLAKLLPAARVVVMLDKVRERDGSVPIAEMNAARKALATSVEDVADD